MADQNRQGSPAHARWSFVNPPDRAHAHIADPDGHAAERIARHSASRFTASASVTLVCEVCAWRRGLGRSRRPSPAPRRCGGQHEPCPPPREGLGRSLADAAGCAPDHHRRAGELASCHAPCTPDVGLCTGRPADRCGVRSARRTPPPPRRSPPHPHWLRGAPGDPRCRRRGRDR